MTRSIIATLALSAIACGEPSYEPQHRSLDALGFTNVHIEGISWYGCAKDEIGYHFTATNAREKPVSGVVCCGFWVKACTVRF